MEIKEEKALEVEQPAGFLPMLSQGIKSLSLRAWLLIILTLVLLIAACFFMLDDSFRVQHVTIKGNHHVLTEQIESSVNISEGDLLTARLGGSFSKLIHFRYGNLENKLEKEYPYIKNAKITAKYPGNVYIEITERKKVAYVAIPDGYAIIAEDGVVLEICEGSVPSGIPEIRGLPIRSAQVGKALDMTSQEGYDVCITILGAVLGADATVEDTDSDFDFLAHVVSIRYCENMTTFIDISVPEVNHIISVKVGQITTISDDMNWLRYAITSGYFKDKSGTVLDMTGSKYVLR